MKSFVVPCQRALMLAATFALHNATRAAEAAADQPLSLQPQAITTSAPTAPGVSERVPSDDPKIENFHAIGLVNGRVNIFRSACPVHDLADTPSDQMTDEQKLAEAKARMRRLYDLGIRTIITFEEPSKIDEGDVPYPSGQEHPTVRASVAMERPAAESVGIRYISRPMTNGGPNSLEDMPTDAVARLLEERTAEILKHSEKGGVLYHCSRGHDRTGIVTAYIRMKYQHWPVEEAIDDMRRYGHNWPKYSHTGEDSSWHENHLRVIDKLLSKPANSP
jgi:protein-tyrosine phosphatase